MLKELKSDGDVKGASSFTLWIEKLSNSKSGLVTLSIISLIESSLPVPILTDPFLAASVLFNRANALKIVLVTTLSSVAGGVLAYYMAVFTFDFLLSLMSPVLMEEFTLMTEANTSSTLVLTLVGAVTPVPYTVVAWAVAVLEGNILVFILGSIFGRGLRYSIVGFCAYRFGPMAIKYAKKYIAISSLVVVLLAFFVVWLKM